MIIPTIFLVILGGVLAYVLRRHLKQQKVKQVLGLILGVVFSIRYLMADIPLESVVALEGLGMSKFLTAMSLILNWLSYAVIWILVIGSFFDFKLLNLIKKYILTPVFLLLIIFLKTYALGILDTFEDVSFRGILIAIEFGLMALLLVHTFLTDQNKYERKDYQTLAIVTIPIFLATLTPHLLKGLFGYAPSYIKVQDFSIYHRFIIYLGIMIPILAWYGLRNKDAHIKKFVLLYMSMAFLFTFSWEYKFDNYLNLKTWPLHLCHTAMFLVPITLIFKSNKIFYFTFFINVFGAFIALIIPNYGTPNLFSTSIFVFYINHFGAFFMPLLMVALGLYERPKFKEFKYSMIGFVCYYVLVLLINAAIGSDFFFINNTFIVDKLGKWWVRNVYDFNVHFQILSIDFVIRPIYQILFFVVYVLIALLMWFIYEEYYRFADSMHDINIRKALLKKINEEVKEVLEVGKNIEIMYPESLNKLRLVQFSKKYASSDVYAVKDASFEVNAGDIFGFLGPNGAGKSTIIKSIVGIQPITEGHIELFGYDVTKQPIIAKRHIGFVPDHYALYEQLTGREYVNYVADLFLVSKEDRDIRLDKYVKIFNLSHAFDQKIKTYSHGMKQKITIMSALVHNPKLWILDEPLTGLDPDSIFQVKEAMIQHAKEGNIVFFSSHIIDVVEKICDRVAIIKKGQIKATLSIHDLESKKMSLEKYFMDVIAQEEEHHV